MDNVELLAHAGSNKNPFVISLREFEGHRLLDIRKCFKKDGEILPTSKGVSLNRTQFHILQRVLKDDTAKIEAWYTSTDEEKNLDLSHERLDKERYKAVHYDVVFEGWKSFELLEVRERGGKVELVLNAWHPWVREFSEICADTSGGNVKSLIFSLLLCFGKSINLLGSRDDMVNEVVSTISFNWGMYLKSYRESAF